MVKVLKKSLFSLRRFIDPENIAVYVTPPCGSKALYKLKLRNLCKVYLKPNISEPFKVNSHEEARYAEQFYFTEIPDKEVFVLDHDTKVKRDITELLDGDYDVSWRVASHWLEHYDLDEWFKYCRIPMPSFGFTVWKNGTHRKIKEELWRNFHDPDMVKGRDGWQNRDEIALAKTCQDMKIRYMTEMEHCYMNRGEHHLKRKPYVLHGEPKLGHLTGFTLRYLRGLKTIVS